MHCPFDGNETGYRKGVGIALLDTGVYPHDDLTTYESHRSFKDFVNDRTEPYDDDGHGTHVAELRPEMDM